MRVYKTEVTHLGSKTALYLAVNLESMEWRNVILHPRLDISIFILHYWMGDDVFLPSWMGILVLFLNPQTSNEVTIIKEDWDQSIGICYFELPLLYILIPRTIFYPAGQLSLGYGISRPPESSANYTYSFVGTSSLPPCLSIGPLCPNYRRFEHFYDRISFILVCWENKSAPAPNSSKEDKWY